jgi:hypothetical protein
MRRLLLGLALAATLANAQSKPEFQLTPAALILHTTAPREHQLEVSLAESDIPLMGKVEHRADQLIFTPALPFTAGTHYSATWESTSGLRLLQFQMQPHTGKQPTVSLQPHTKLPANALKCYLHFSQPMEQGVFLDRITLLNPAGTPIAGPFRETELWSPDGQRLTLWFHPGRQKTGVNLNTDEGPVLLPNQRYTLVVANTWRSTQGIPLGQDQCFTFDTAASDHKLPDPQRWTITTAPAGSMSPIVLRFDEPMDPAMVPSAIRLLKDSQAIDTDSSSDTHHWQAKPKTPWSTGSYQILVTPDLEDLAGNAPHKPFEVDLSSATSLLKPEPITLAIQIK